MIRLKDPQSPASPGLRQLLRKVQPTRGMTEAEKARSAARIAQLVAGPPAPAPLLASPKIIGAVVGIGGGIALLANLMTPPSTPEDCAPLAMTSPLEAPARLTDTDESAKNSLGDKPIQASLTTTAGPPAVPTTSPLKSTPPRKPNRVPVATTTASTKTVPSIANVVSSAAPEPSSTANDESRYIDEATTALSTSPQDALLRLDEHAKLFPDGMLANERDFLIIRALLKLGRDSEARKQAKSALRRENSPYKTRIQELLLLNPSNKSD